MERQNQNCIYRKKVKTLPSFDRVGDFYVIECRPDQVEVILRKDHVQRNEVNGGFLDSNLNPLGVVITHGKIIADRVSWRPPRACFVLKDGKADIIQGVEKASDLGKVDFALGCMSLLPLKIQEEGIQADISLSKRPRTLLGINTLGNILIALTDQNKSLVECQEFMRTMKCEKAMNLDGGGSTSVNWQGRSVIKGRKVSTVLKIKEV